MTFGIIRTAMSQQAAPASFASQPAADRAAMLWGIVVGLLQAAPPLDFWWLDRATVYALGLAVIASVYIGFAVADGRPQVIAVESSVTFVFVAVGVLIAAAGRLRAPAPAGLCRCSRGWRSGRRCAGRRP